MNKGDAILRLLSEIKLELKDVKERIEKIQTKLDTFEQQNQVNNTVERKKQQTKPDKQEQRDWKYPAKLK
ncbi:hypothetical protein [Bacillus cereus]|uniref:hypothetical protein n=1 Tax=Bacillus cereus TaxID=1396 RepID=UPI000BF25047|nr:hypothetical protein [Bacillus cereus]PEV02425.1 hypothetical protein CN407_27040 [Bacillus cereus]PGM68486.1 hypothetical protein CN950_07655 [Bacillus cereus]HDR8449206.1 hypothetical protein [Bacillus cereus]HDR8461064.1 hypothetical protein [Bacillus cereus]